jgi:hypothetical protein
MDTAEDTPALNATAAVDDPDDYLGAAMLSIADVAPRAEKLVLREEIRRFFMDQQEWHLVLKQGYVPDNVIAAVGTTLPNWMRNWEKIAKHFRIMNWWEHHKNMYPHIYIVACKLLAAPDSNGFQERTFSAATWMDGKLKTRQTDATFQLKVLLYKNQEFIRECKFRATEEHKRKARANALQAFKDTFAARKAEIDKANAEKESSEESSDEENEAQMENVTVSVLPDDDESEELYDDLELLLMDFMDNEE